MSLLNTRKKQNKFVITMIIVIVCATMINYGLYSLLGTYFKQSNNDIIQQNIMLMIIIIGITSIVMFLLIPRENADNIISGAQISDNSSSDSGGAAGLDSKTTVAEELRDMIEEELQDNKKEDGLF